MLSMGNRVIEYAFERGYRVNSAGLPVAPSGKLRKTHNNEGYLTFGVNPPFLKNPFRVPVHRLVAYQKFGEAIFEPGIVVRHRDNDSANNCPKNILIGTNTDNQLDRPEEERLLHGRKAGRANSPLNAGAVREIRRLREVDGWSYAALLDRFPIAKSTLSYICNYKTWKEV